MSKFAGTQTVQRSPLRAETPTLTHEGGDAWALSAEGQLFLLAATNMVGESTFYETAAARDFRFEQLVHDVTKLNPEWMQGFAPYLRSELKMRSASVVLACEYVKAGGEHGRQMIDAVCQRADEPAEVLSYWMSRHGRNIPMAVKRGVADAVRRLYTERNVLRWNSSRRGMDFADVIELTHPRPRTDIPQSELFRFLLDEKHHGDGDGSELALITQDRIWQLIPENGRRLYVSATHDGIPSTWSWERLAGWLPGGMDAEGWEAAIPNMGVMALIRNLRNFDVARISESMIDFVISQITDTEQVFHSRIFPYQVWSAYREAPSDNWKRALAKTLDLACVNTPDLGPGTLVLIDTSGSMSHQVSGRSTVARVEVAGVMAAALWHKHPDTEVGIFATGVAKIDLEPGTSALQLTQGVVNLIGQVGHSTNLHQSIGALFDPRKHQRVVVFTDDQAHDDSRLSDSVPRIYTFDLGGYSRQAQKNGAGGRFIFGGYSDSTMAGIAAIESVGHMGWSFR